MSDNQNIYLKSRTALNNNLFFAIFQNMNIPAGSITGRNEYIYVTINFIPIPVEPFVNKNNITPISHAHKTVKNIPIEKK